MRGLALSLAAGLSALAGTAAAQSSNSTCADGLYMIIARGTGEEPGPGVSKIVGQQVSRRVPGSRFVALDYPASFTNPDYDDSEAQGADAMKEAVTSYHAECPEGRIAVLGYSQGAQATMDAICGGSGSPFSNITAVPSDVVKGNVVAVVLLGNPSHNPNSTFEKGTSKNEGIFPREDDGACKDYGDRMASYCDTGDVYCDRGDNREIHGHYLAEYGDDIVDFIVDRYEQSSTPTSDDSPSGTPGPETTSEPATPDSAAPSVAPAAGVMVLAGLAMMAML